MMDNFVMHSYKKMKAVGSSKCEKVKDLCANWIAKHYRPIQIVEDKGFIELVEFVNHLKNAVELPCRTSVSERIRKKAAKGRIELKQRTVFLSPRPNWHIRLRVMSANYEHKRE